VFETRKEGELILIFAKKKKIVQEREDWECPLSSKNNKKGIFRRTFSRASEFNLNTRSSRSVIITIKRRVVSRGARD
jgi:hypothetical protein